MARYGGDEQIRNWWQVWGAVGGVSAVVIAIGLLILASMTIRIVPTGYEGIYLEWGSAKYTVGEGIHFVTPLMGGMENVNLQTQKYDTVASAASKDLQVVNSHITLNYRVPQSKALDVYRTLRNDYEVRVITPMIQEAVKASTARFTAEELIEKRPLVKDDIKTHLTDRLRAEYGIEVVEVSITNFDFSPEFNAAIEAKMVTQQKALQASYELQQRTVEVKQNIVVAEANANATVAKAQGEAIATLVKAEAEAKAIQLKTAQVSDKYVALVYAQQWNGVMPQIVGTSNPFLMLPTNLTRGD